MQTIFNAKMLISPINLMRHLDVSLSNKLTTHFKYKNVRATLLFWVKHLVCNSLQKRRKRADQLNLQGFLYYKYYYILGLLKKSRQITWV